MTTLLPEGVVPVHERADVVPVDLDQPLPAFPDDGRVRLLVVKLCGEAIGTVHVTGGASADTLAHAVASALPHNLPHAAKRHGVLGHLTAAGLPHTPCPVRDGRAAVRAARTPLSIVLCTRGRPEQARVCLESLLALDHPVVDLVVVDNAPLDDLTESVFAELAAKARPGITLRYLRDPVPGLSHARNVGTAAAHHDLIGFVDDDEVIDVGWATAVVAEFSSAPTVGAVSGVVLPYELATEPQVQFEQFGGHSKGRGFQRVVFDPEDPERQSPLYPLPAFGVGANMAFRREALAQAGGFDTALGAGTAAMSCEDTAAFSEVMLAGWKMVYTAGAITWHVHRRDEATLTEQLTGYGVGLGAYYSALVLRDPRRLGALVRLVPRALADLRHPDSARNATLGQLPVEVGSANLRAIVRGPAAYARARREARRHDAV